MSSLIQAGFYRTHKLDCTPGVEYIQLETFAPELLSDSRIYMTESERKTYTQQEVVQRILLNDPFATEYSKQLARRSEQGKH